MHARHWMHAVYDSDSVFWPGAGWPVWMAPVGQTRAHSSHAVQWAKSITGNPNDTWVPKGFASVRTPVLRLFERMLNMCFQSRTSNELTERYRSFPEYDRLKL